MKGIFAFLSLAFIYLVNLCGCFRFFARKGTPRTNKSYTYYRCTRKRKNYSCKQPFIEEKELTRQLEELFNSLTIRKEFEEMGLRIIQAFNEEESKERHTITETQTKALNEAQKTADRPLHSHRGVQVNIRLCIRRHPGGRGPRLLHERKVKVQFASHERLLMARSACRGGRAPRV